MENIRLETDYKLETIFTSLTLNTTNKLNEILDTPELDLTERSSITKYLYLINQIGNVPSLELLKREFPDLYFEDVRPIQGDELDDYIKIYIANTKNLAISRKLSRLATNVRTNGMTPEISDILGELSKSDTVEIPYKDIALDIEKIYKAKKPDSGIPTGVSAVDKDTSGLQPRWSSHYTRFYWKF